MSKKTTVPVIHDLREVLFDGCPPGYIYVDANAALRSCNWWRGYLGLLDWRVAIRLVGSADLNRGRSDGDGCIWLLDKSAVIRLVLPQGGHFTTGMFRLDHEEILVHELLHLHFFGIEHYCPRQFKDKDMPAYVCMEQSIDAMARGLVEMRRGSSGP